MRHLAAVVTTLVLATGAAHAFNSVPGHTGIEVKPIKKTVNGAKVVTGCTVTFCVKKAGGGSYSGAKAARPSVVTPEVGRRLADSTDESRWAVFDPARSQAVEIFDDIDVPQDNVVVPGSIKIDYAKHGLQSGQKLTLITAWKYYEGYAPHVYGTVTQYGEENEFVLP